MTPFEMLRRERARFVLGTDPMSQTNERVFETYVEEISPRKDGLEQGDRAEWDMERALFPAGVVAFLQATQPKLWEEMQALHGAGLESLLINALVKELDSRARCTSCATASSSTARLSGWPTSSPRTG